MANIYDLTDTWNDAGTTFNAISMDVTNTASASGSKLLNLGVGGVTKFSVGPDGVPYLPSGTAGSPGLAFEGDQDTGISRLSSNKIGFSTGGFSAMTLDTDFMTLNVKFSTGGGSIIGDRPEFASKTSDYNILSANILSTLSGNAFDNNAATGEVIFTLPEFTLWVGMHYPFFVATAQYVRVKAPTGWKIRDSDGALSADGGYIRCNLVGGMIRAQLGRNAEWIIVQKTRTWTVDA